MEKCSLCGQQIRAKSLEKIRTLVKVWKILNSVSEDDKVWDRVHFPKNSRAAKDLLDLFEGDVSAAIHCMESVFDRLKGRGLDLSFGGIVKNSDVCRQIWLEKKQIQG